MSEPEQPQIYLISPPEFELSTFPDRLARVLDAQPIACMRLALSSRDEDMVLRAADACRAVTDPRDVALVVAEHTLLAERLGLDGVHLGDAGRSVREARKTLGPDAIVGAGCGTSRHDGMNAGEAGADYISFGPITASSLGDGSVAEPDLFSWWSDMIEIPVVAEGGLTQSAIETLAPITDFFGIREIWDSETPADTLQALTAPLR